MLLAATDLEKVFGTVSPPPQLQPLISKGGQGAGGINIFLNNLISLIYEVAVVLVVIMLLWGGMQLILSGGDKEAVAGAQKRITFALIGLIFLAVAFALLQVFGIFTGFTTFFNFS